MQAQEEVKTEQVSPEQLEPEGLERQWRLVQEKRPLIHVSSVCSPASVHPLQHLHPLQHQRLCTGARQFSPSVK